MAGFNRYHKTAPLSWLTSKDRTHSSRRHPRGMYVIVPTSHPSALLQAWLAKSWVAGLHYRLGWSTLEPTAGAYTLSDIATVASLCAAAGKQLTLRVLASGSGTMPSWLPGLGCTTHDWVDMDPDHDTYGQSVSTPHYWNEVFLARWSALLSWLGSQLVGTSALVHVAVTGPAFGGEMYIGDDSNTSWLTEGLTTPKLVNAWLTVMQRMTTAFPSQNLACSIAVPFNAPLGNGEDCLLQIVEHAKAYGIALCGNWLKAGTNTNWLPYKLIQQHTVGVRGFQQLCNSANPRYQGTLHESLVKAVAANVGYIEAYRADIDFQSEWEWFASRAVS